MKVIWSKDQISIDGKVYRLPGKIHQVLQLGEKVVICYWPPRDEYRSRNVVCIGPDGLLWEIDGPRGSYIQQYIGIRLTPSNRVAARFSDGFFSPEVERYVDLETGKLCVDDAED